MIVSAFSPPFSPWIGSVLIDASVTVAPGVDQRLARLEQLVILETVGRDHQHAGVFQVGHGRISFGNARPPNPRPSAAFRNEAVSRAFPRL